MATAQLRATARLRAAQALVAVHREEHKWRREQTDENVAVLSNKMDFQAEETRQFELWLGPVEKYTET